MTEKDFIQPPRIANWLISLFASGKEAEPLLGDMLEEFSQLTSESNVVFARRWYWRQTRKTVTRLIGSAFCAAPRSMAATIVVGLLLSGRSGTLERAILAVVFRHGILDPHFHAYVLLPAIGHVIASLFIGCVVALAAKRREMAAVAMLGVALVALTGTAALLALAKGYTSNLWMLPWNIANWVAILMGGAIVRIRRAALTQSASAS